MKLRFNAISATFVVLLFINAFLAAAEEVVESEQISDDETVKPLGPITEPPIKLVHVLNPGEREYLSPNLIGLQNIAMTFLPLSMNFLNIIDAFREVVNGVKYDIILNAIDTKENNTEIICHLIILEKPWLRTEWGDKKRELMNSNCTSDADNLTNPAGRANTLNDKYTRNAIFNGGSRNDLSVDEMAKLESQILPFNDGGSKLKATSKSAGETTSTSTSTTTTSTTATSTSPTTEHIEAANQQNEQLSNGEIVEATATQTNEFSETEKKWIDDILSVGAVNFENTRLEQQQQQQQQESINDAKQTNFELSSQQQAKVVLEQRQQQEEKQPQQFDTQDYVVEDNQQQEQQEEYQDSQTEQLNEAPIQSRQKRSGNAIIGAPNHIAVEEAEDELKVSLSKIAAGDGPTYKIKKINSASRQVVSGILMKINADLLDAHENVIRCEIEIWTRAWIKEDGTETTIKCADKEPLKRRYRRSVEDAEKKTHKKHNHHNLGKVEHLFNKFQTRYNRNYHTTQERQMRLRIFRQNLRTIEELNRNEQGSAKYGITEFADLTSSEYKMRTGLWQREIDKPSGHPIAEIPDIDLPKEFDWREKGAISKVKNQANCGSCWAFSVTGNIEGLHAVKTGKLEEYSEQELLDCDTVDSACNGGLPDNAYKAIEKIGGLELESDYPYDAKKEQCHFNKDRVRVRVKGAIDLPKNETAMQQWLIANGPISIGINANAMQFYRGGVSHPWRPLCSHSNLDHGVLIVGYGVSDYPMFNKTLPYWIVKNSWGSKWGEQGYYRVYRGDNTCGVSEMATSAVLDD